MRKISKPLTGAIFAILSAAFQGSAMMADDAAPTSAPRTSAATQTSYKFYSLKGKRAYCPPPAAPVNCPPAETPVCPPSPADVPVMDFSGRPITQDPNAPSSTNPQTQTNNPTQAQTQPNNAANNNANANNQPAALQLNPLTDRAPTASAAPVPGFIGDFFGGSTTGNTNSNSVVEQVTRSTNPSNPNPPSNVYVVLQNLGGVNQPPHLQSVAATGTLTNGVFSDSVHGGGLKLVSAGNQSVLFNSPQDTTHPNPRNVEVFSVISTSNSGGLDPAITTGRTKLAEGSTPIPRDRVFLNYSYFADAQLSSAGGIAVNRYTPGFEKTFFNGNASVEVRVPFASTLTSNIDATTGFINPTDMQFGNVTIYNKALLYQDQTFATSAGLGLTLPTANNINVFTGPTQTLHISNDAVHLLPFLGALYTPNDRFYTQGFLQFDLDSNGNRVDSNVNTANGITNPGGVLTRAGTFRDAAYVYASVGTGYWLYRSATPGPFGITGFSPVGELHYNRNLQNGNVINGQIGSGDMATINTLYGSAFTNIEVLNAVVGANMLFGRNRILTAGYCTPLGMGVDKQFAGELRIMFNWYFGPGGNSSTLTRAGRVQF